MQHIDHAGAAGAAHIVGQPEFQVGVVHLAGAGFAAQLLIHLNHLGHAAGAHRVAFGLEAAAGVDRTVARPGRAPLVHRVRAFAGGKEAQILGGYDFGNGKAVVDFGHAHLLRPDARHGVSLGGGGFGGGQRSQLLGIMQGTPGSLPDAGDMHRLVGELARDFTGHQQHAGSAVGDGSAVVQAQRPGNPGIGAGVVEEIQLVIPFGNGLAPLFGPGLPAFHHIPDGDLELGLGVELAVFVVFDANLQQMVEVGFVAIHMGFGDGAEYAGESEAGRHFIQPVGGGSQHVGDAFRGQGGHLFHAAHQNDIVHPAGDGHCALAQGGTAAGAGVFHPGNRGRRHPQPVGDNGGGMPLVLKQVGGVVAQVARLNVGGGNAGVNVVLQVVESFHEQVAG